MTNIVNSTRIELLTKDNYDTWCIQVQALLIKHDEWGYVAGTIVKPSAKSGETEPTAAQLNWVQNDLKAKSDLILSISPSELQNVRGCDTSQEVWEKLKKEYASKGPARKATLLKHLMLHKLKEDGDVRQHIMKFFEAVDKLTSMNISINKDLLAIMLLYSLPPSYENFRCAIETRDELPEPETLKIKIIEESESRQQSRESVNTSGALAAKYRSNIQGMYKGGPSLSNTGNWNQRYNLGAGNSQSNNNKPFKFKYSDLVLWHYRLGHLNYKDISKTFSKTKASVIDKGGNVKLLAKRMGDLYYICPSTEQCNNVLTNKYSDLVLWHYRLGHLNYKDMYTLIQRGLIHVDKPIQTPSSTSCSTCLQGKITVQPFPKREQLSNNKLEIVHADVWGPSRAASQGGAKYFVVFTDDCTRWGEIYFMSNYIRNRCPTKALYLKIPFEEWTGRKVNLKHLRVFGTDVVILDKTPNKDKFSPRGLQGKFVGYSETSKAYRIWLKNGHKIVVARDVKFLSKFDDKGEHICSDRKFNLAINGSTGLEWKDAILVEISGLIENDVWDVVERPKSHNVIGCRTVLTNKFGPNGELIKRKARVVAQGFSQRPNIDYKETFAPVARLSSLRMVMAISARFDLRIHQIDIEVAYQIWDS